MAEGKSFLRRWSAQKIIGDASDGGGPSPVLNEPKDSTYEDGVGSEMSAAPLSKAVDGEGDGVLGDGCSAQTPEEIAAALPDIDTLDRDSDYTPFLGEGVPRDLAQKALRKLWRSDPALSNLDGLNDYDDDYSALGIVEQIVETVFEAVKPTFEEQDDPGEDARAYPGSPVSSPESSSHAAAAQVGPNEPVTAKVGDVDASRAQRDGKEGGVGDRDRE
ncbi:uncharacterized protein DUF3306 [Varunaivibrio sulfuroxidans]|uniref:Uncharacterized protein DUF3306 n=2 Tax=Varunaivibrio sulfuroxidans TaxID=1773489 RepID=A0A4R3JBX9_9PROT|nr:uncharacterized protein DUF3306 [Varunaivibrio sulfuroxidans]